MKIALLVEEGNFIRQTDLSFPLEPADPWPWCGVGTQVLLHARAQKKPGFWGLRYWQLWMDRAGVSASTSGEKVLELTVSVCQVSKKGSSRAESSACVSHSFCCCVLIPGLVLPPGSQCFPYIKSNEREAGRGGGFACMRLFRD